MLPPLESSSKVSAPAASARQREVSEPPPRSEVDANVRETARQAGQQDAPPPEHYVHSTVARGETMTEVAQRYQTTVPMLQAANPQVEDPSQIEPGQKLNVPIGQGYGTEPEQAAVEPGQTLSDMARQYGVPASEIAAANRHALGLGQQIGAGEEIWIPARQPATPLDQAVSATDHAMASARDAENNYHDLAAQPQPNVQALQMLEQRLVTARADLSAAVAAELEVRAGSQAAGGASPTEAQYQAAASEVQARYEAAAPGEQQLLGRALDGLTQDRQAAALQQQAAELVTQARGEGDPPEQLARLQKTLQAATPELRQAVLDSASGQSLLQDAADWAMAPLQGGDAVKAYEAAQQDYNGAGQQVPGAKAMERLDHVTQGLDPELAADITRRALPTFDRYAQSYQSEFGGQPLGPTGMGTMLTVLDRGTGTTQGAANFDRAAATGAWDDGAVRNHIAEGGSPAYAVALAQRPDVDTNRIAQTAYDGVAAYRAKIGETAQAYSTHMSELGWLVENHSGSMTPEQLQQAITDYTASKGAAWEQQGQQLQDQLAEQGATLQDQLIALQQLPAGTAGRDEAIAEALNDPAVQLALNTAWEKKPELLQGERGNNVLGFFADPTVKGSAKLTDTGRKLLTDLATQYAKHKVGDALNQFNPNDPASVAKTEAAIDSLRNGRLASLLGVSTKEMDSALDALSKAMPAAGDTPEQIAGKMKQLDTALGSIGEKVTGRLGFDPADANRGLKAFDKSTVPGQFIRGLGLALGGVGMLASGSTAISDPTLKNWLKTAGDGLGLTQKGLELALGMGKVDEASLLGKAGGSLVGRVLGAGMAVFDVWSAVQSAQAGDYTSAGLYGAGAAGSVMAALFTGPVGWAGMALVGISAAGLWGWSSVKESRVHEPDYDGGTSMQFLQHSGLTEQAARSLTDQSGDGHSPMPLLERYAQLKGLHLDQAADQQKFVDWLNAMPPEALAALRDNVHREMDHIGGDVSRFEATASGDAWQVTDTQQRPWFAATGNARPESVAQLDAILQVLGVSALAP